MDCIRNLSRIWSSGWSVDDEARALLDMVRAFVSFRFNDNHGFFFGANTRDFITVRISVRRGEIYLRYGQASSVSILLVLDSTNLQSPG